MSVTFWNPTLLESLDGKGEGTGTNIWWSPWGMPCLLSEPPPSPLQLSFSPSQVKEPVLICLSFWKMFSGQWFLTCVLTTQNVHGGLIVFNTPWLFCERQVYATEFIHSSKHFLSSTVLQGLCTTLGAPRWAIFVEPGTLALLAGRSCELILKQLDQTRPRSAWVRRGWREAVRVFSGSWAELHPSLAAGKWGRLMPAKFKTPAWDK